jgi:hypothetical protein
MKYRLETVIGGKGSESHQFTSALRGLDISSTGQVYAVGDSEVKVCDSSGNLLRHWSTGKPGFSIAVQGEDVLVGEEGQLEFFDLRGQLKDVWRDSERLGLVTAIGFAGDSILIADALDRCIRRYDKDGTFLNDIGKDNRMKGFNIPNGALDFSLDNKGIIHACNPGKHRVERYTTEGVLLGHIGRFDGVNPQGFAGCCNPTNVAVSGDGRVFVTEKAGPRAKVYTADGQLLAVIAADIFDANCKNMDLAVDSEGRVFVADTVHLHINAFVVEEGG